MPIASLATDTSSVFPLDPTNTPANPSRLANKSLFISNSPSRLSLCDNFVALDTASSAARHNDVEIPVYIGGTRRDGDRITDLQSFSETWGELYEHLTTQTLSEREILAVLKDGILQSRMGRNLERVFVEAIMRSIQPKGDLTPQRLREIVEVICHLPANGWAQEFGEFLNFPRQAANWSVAGFIQGQLTLSRKGRDEQIADGQLLTDAQWQCLCTILEESPVWLSEGLDQRLEESPADSQWMDLEDIAHIRPPPFATNALLSECLQVISVQAEHNGECNEFKGRIDELLQCIVAGTDPIQATHAAAETVSFEFLKPFKPQSDLVSTYQRDFPLLAVLEEIERKSDFYDFVSTSGPRVPKGLLAQTVYLLNVGNAVQELPGRAFAAPDKIQTAQKDQTTELTASAAPVKPKVATGSIEQLEELARQADALLTKVTHTLTGWRPVGAAVPDPRPLIRQFLGSIEGWDVRTPFRNVPSSSYGTNPDSPYVPTTQVADTTGDTFSFAAMQQMGAKLGTWLNLAAGYLGTVEGVIYAGTAGFAQRHPHTTATIAMAAIHAAVSEFYDRWFADSSAPDHANFAQETDPELRKRIIDNVGSILDKTPEVVETVRERMAASTYADPHQDPELVPDVKALLQRSAVSDPNMTVAELVNESIFEERINYSNLRFSTFGVDENGNIQIEEEDIPANSQRSKSSEPADESAQWVIDTLSEADITRHADQKLQAEVVDRLSSNQHTPLPISKASWIHKPLALYQEALNDAKVLAWFESKGLELDTIIIESNRIFGFATRDGKSSMQTFFRWDNSGWWQVSAQVLTAREVLDPGDHGLPYVNEEPKLIPRDVILQFYGQTPPSSDDEAISLGGRLRTDGWPAFDNIKQGEALDQAKEFIKEERARAQLSYELEQCVRDKADDEAVSLSSRFSRVANDSPLEKKSSDILHHLDDFLRLPEMIAICKSRGFDCAESAVRISESRIQVLNSDTLWHDITDLLSPELNKPFNELLQRVKETGNALYSTLSLDLLQILNFRGFGSPKTVGEVRNVIRWLQTSLPTAMPLGDCGAGLLAPSQSPANVTLADRAKIIGMSNTLLNGASSIIEVLGSDLPFDSSIEHRRVNAEAMLEEMLTTAQSTSWGQQLINTLGWYGASEGQTASIEHQQHLLIAAIKLAVDPDAPGKPGTVAGYDIYQPKNLGRDLNEVRADIEQHLMEHKGVSPQTAPLIAHLFLVDAAPEFLAQDLDEAIKVGNASWMTLRLGVAIAEIQKPGCSRAMTSAELTALALLTPTAPEQQSLFKGLAIDILVAWGIMSGVVPQRSNALYSANDYSVAARRFATQRAELSEAFEGFKRDLVTRKEIAVRELRMLYGSWTSTPIEDIKVRSGGTEKPLVEAYMDGDLSEAGWYPSNALIAPHTFDWFRIKLPDLSALLTASVDNYFSAFKNSFMVATKSLIATLPLEDRRSLELGEVTIYTLREETGEILEDETPEIQAVFRGRQGVLLRSEYQSSISYYEVFPGRMSIVKRTDLPDKLTLDGVIKTVPTKISKGPAIDMPKRFGAELPFDFSAYSEGSAPEAGAQSKKIIIEQLGNTLPGRTVRNQATYVPTSYFSKKTADIASLIVDDNLLIGQKEFLLKKANGQTTAEENRAYWGKVKDFLVQLIPFVGCVNDLKSGERIRLINGAFGCFTDLISGLNALAGGVGKISNVLKSVSSVSVKAFETLKISAGTILSVINPLDGVPDLIAGGGRAVGAFGKMLMTGSFALTEAGISRLSTCVDRLRGYFGGCASTAAVRLPGRTNVFSVMGRINNTNIAATLENGKWYALDRNGNPIGPQLNHIVPLPVARE